MTVLATTEIIIANNTLLLYTHVYMHSMQRGILIDYVFPVTTLLQASRIFIGADKSSRLLARPSGQVRVPLWILGLARSAIPLVSTIIYAHCIQLRQRKTDTQRRRFALSA